MFHSLFPLAVPFIPVEFCKPYRAIGQADFSNSLFFSPGCFSVNAIQPSKFTNATTRGNRFDDSQTCWLIEIYTFNLTSPQNRRPDPWRRSKISKREFYRPPLVPVRINLSNIKGRPQCLPGSLKAFIKGNTHRNDCRFVQPLPYLLAQEEDQLVPRTFSRTLKAILRQLRA